MICRPHFLLLGSTAHNHQDLSRDTYDLDEPVTSKALPLPPQAPAPFQTASLTVGNGPCALGVPGWNKTTKQNKNAFLYYQDEYIKISSQKTVRSCQVTRKSSPCFISRTKSRRPHGSLNTPVTAPFMIVQAGKLKMSLN